MASAGNVLAGAGYVRPMGWRLCYVDTRSKLYLYLGLLWKAALRQEVQLAVSALKSNVISTAAVVG